MGKTNTSLHTISHTNGVLNFVIPFRADEVWLWKGCVIQVLGYWGALGCIFQVSQSMYVNIEQQGLHEPSFGPSLCPGLQRGKRLKHLWLHTFPVPCACCKCLGLHVSKRQLCSIDNGKRAHRRRKAEQAKKSTYRGSHGNEQGLASVPKQMQTCTSKINLQRNVKANLPPCHCQARNQVMKLVSRTRKIEGHVKTGSRNRYRCTRARYAMLPVVGTLCGRVANVLPGPSFALLRNLRRMFLTLTTNAVSVLNLPLTTNVASVLKLPLTTNVRDAYDECCFSS